MQNGPELWDAILAEMPVGSIIAGGCIRDAFLGVEPKDIDVFHPSFGAPTELQDPPTQRRYFTEPFDARHGFQRIDDLSQWDEEYKAISDILVVSRGELHGYTIDLVGLTWPKLDGNELVKTFDFGITRTFYQNGTIFDTWEARLDRQFNVVTMWTSERRERSLARFARFNARHGGKYQLLEKVLVDA